MCVPPRQKLLADLPSLLLSTSTNNFRSIQISVAPIYGSVCPYLTLARQQSKGWWAPQSGFNLTGKLKKKKESPWNHNYFFCSNTGFGRSQEREGIKQIIPSVSGRAGSKVGWIGGIGRGRCFCVSLLLISGDWKLPATVHRWAPRQDYLSQMSQMMWSKNNIGGRWFRIEEWGWWCVGLETKPTENCPI